MPERTARNRSSSIAPRSKPFSIAPRVSSRSRPACRKSDMLRGRMIVNLFFEASTRTRTSFEIAAKRLGADAISITASGSSVSKGESLVDTLNTLAAMHPDAIVMRHAASGRAAFPGALSATRPSSTPAMARMSIPRRRCSMPAPFSIAAPRWKACAWRSSATSRTAAWRAPTCICSPSSARKSCCAGRPRCCRRNWRKSLPVSADPRHARGHSRRRRHHDAARSTGAPARSRVFRRRILPVLWPAAGAHGARQAGRHRHASRARSIGAARFRPKWRTRSAP